MQDTNHHTTNSSSTASTTATPRRRSRRTTPWLARRLRRCRAAAEAGMSTAEYAVGTIAACGFAAVLYKIVTSGPVRTALTGVIEKALHAPF
jgi:hypothetical protein